MDYTTCNKIGLDDKVIPNVTCANDIIANPPTKFSDFCKCRLEFSLDRPFEGEVFMYYELTNFYQNHRRYVKSRDDEQLLGRFGDPSEQPPRDCAPFATGTNGKTIVPCGAIANSLFNDTLSLRSNSNGNIPVERTGIAWPSDKEIKFKNPENLKKGLKRLKNFYLN